ncbi:MAG: hypothetical protein JNK04_00840, partial [Myxococcales bacterium]|nr:hypothetical protein [Myxococcales bacterium]
MSIEIVRGELERLFSLEELFALSSDLLSFTPAEVGGTASKASFAKALIERCVETHSTGALLDAMVGSRADLDAKVRDLQKTGLHADPELKAGSSIAGHDLVRKLAEGPRAAVWLAKKDGEERVLKLFKSAATSDTAGVRRFIAQSRLLGRVRHENLPDEVEAGTVDGRVYTSSKLGSGSAEGQPLSARVARTGALHLNEARPLVRG